MSIAVSIWGDVDELEKESDSLSHANKYKRDKFVLEYIILLAKGKENEKQAAINAGYSEKGAKQTAWRLMRDPQIKTLIEAKKEKIKKTMEIDAEYLAKETLHLLKIGKGEISQKFFVKGKYGGSVYDECLTDISAIKGSLEILGKLTGSFTENKNVTHTMTEKEIKEMSDEDIYRNLDEEYSI